MRFLISFIVVALSLCAAPAHADWQYTRWGMTPEQVAAASAGAVVTGPGDPQQEIPGEKIGASGTYSSGSLSFKVNFHFADGKLVDVRMTLISSDARTDGFKIKNYLDGRYGKPFMESYGIGPIITYHDSEHNNRIDLLIFGNSSANLEYRPLRDANSSGL